MTEMRWPSMPEDTLRAICDAVEAQGGNQEDAEDILDVWQRIHGDKHGRAARLRYDAANPTCRCADGGVPTTADDRCERCCGIRSEAHAGGGG